MGEKDESHRQFETGANRDNDLGKLDYEGFLNPLVLERYSQYLNDHRKLPDGTLRDSDNWQRGIPTEVYMKSGLRHVFDTWSAHRGYRIFDPKTLKPIDIEDAICAVLFNFQGYLLELIHNRIDEQLIAQEGVTAEVEQHEVVQGAPGDSEGLVQHHPALKSEVYKVPHQAPRHSDDESRTGR